MVTGNIYAQAAATPDKPAVVYDNHVMTYGRFAGLIDATRRRLAGQVTAGDVAVLAIRSLLDAWIIGLALRSLGLITVVARSEADIALLGLRRLGCVVTVASEPWPDLDGVCAAQGWALIRLTGEAYADASDRPNLPAPTEAPGGHILLTSGTTGQYKKLLLAPQHEAPQWARRRTAFELSGDSAVCLFDFGGWTGVGYKAAACVWDVGGTVVLYQAPGRHRALAYPGLTHALMVPQMLSELLLAPDGAFQRNDALRLSVTGGALSELLADQAVARLTRRLQTHIGSTETSTFALTPIASHEDLRWHRILPGYGVEVVGDDDAPTPRGEVGLLRVRVEHGSGEYLDDPEASRAFFRHGYFYTGDLAVMRADGRLALQGRVTDVINLSGDKRPAGPIETALQRALGVSAVCVFSAQNARAEEEIHVAVETAAAVDQAVLSQVVAAALPGVAQVRVHAVPALPRNDMGKVLRDVLRARLLSF